MSSSDLVSLNKQFAIAGQVEFRAVAGDFVAAEIANRHATATIALQGAHVMTFQPRGQQPVLWLSKYAKFEAGKSIRGGVPVCWPWFGPHVSQASFPGHGFARTVPWQIMGCSELPSGETRLVFEIIQTEATRAQWPHPSVGRLTVTVGSALTVELATRNTGGEAFMLGEALHTYFHIGDIAATRIGGLEGCAYLDKTDGGKRKTQQGPVTIAAETDRVYLDTASDCVIEDAGLRRRIRIAKSGSLSTVVWNPWVEKAEKMGDFGENGYRGMVCVETANAADNVVSVAPGAEHRMTAIISVEAI